MLKNLFFPPESAVKGQFKRLHLTLWSLLKRQFFDFSLIYFVAFFLLGLTHWIQAEIPFMAKDLAEILGQEQETDWGSTILKFCLLAFGIIICRTLSRHYFFYPARVQQKWLRVEMLDLLEKTPPTRIKDESGGQLFQIVMNDIDQIRALVGFVLLQIGNILLAMAILLPKMIGFSGRLTLALVPMLLSFFLFTLIVSRNRELYKEAQGLQGDVQNFIIESYQGKQTIKNFNAESNFEKRFKKLSLLELQNFFKAGVYVSFASPLVPLGVGLSLVWGAFIIKQEGLGASSLVLFSGLTYLFLGPLRFLSWIGVVFTRSMGSWDRIRSVVEKAKTVSGLEKRIQSFDFSAHEEMTTAGLELWDKEIKASFPSHKWSIIVGHTGVGKSTLLERLCIKLKHEGVSADFVHQAPYLYNDSLLANIFLGRCPTENQKEQAYEWLQIFELGHLAAGRDQLLGMEVGENGKRLSGGQAKRLGLVRSLMSEAEWLIWDDPFSSIDIQLEGVILKKLQTMPSLKMKTFIFAGHRATTVKRCDHYLYINQKFSGLLKTGVPQEDLNNPQSDLYEFFKDQLA